MKAAAFSFKCLNRLLSRVLGSEGHGVSCSAERWASLMSFTKEIGVGALEGFAFAARAIIKAYVHQRASGDLPRNE